MAGGGSRCRCASRRPFPPIPVKPGPREPGCPLGMDASSRPCPRGRPCWSTFLGVADRAHMFSHDHVERPRSCPDGQTQGREGPPASSFARASEPSRSSALEGLLDLLTPWSLNRSASSNESTNGRRPRILRNWTRNAAPSPPPSVRMPRQGCPDFVAAFPRNGLPQVFRQPVGIPYRPRLRVQQPVREDHHPAATPPIPGRANSPPTPPSRSRSVGVALP